MGNFSKGGKAAREESKKSFPSFKKTQYLTLQDGESTVIRLIDDHDEWIFINQHAFVPTKGPRSDAKQETKAKWPKNMNAVCRKSRNADTGEFVFPEFAEDGCFICDHMTNPKNNKKYFPSIKLWARAVLRDEIKGTPEMVEAGHIKPHQVGKTVGVQDREVEVEVPETDAEGKETGKTKTVQQKAVVVINMGMKNFFGALQASAEAYGTALDRDYKVTRRGQGLETEYDIVPLDAIHNEDGTIYTLEEPEVRARYEGVVDLEAVITEQASDRHYATFFDTSKEIPQRGGDKADSDDEDDETPAASASPAQPIEAENKPSEDAMQKMRDRLMSSSQG